MGSPISRITRMYVRKYSDSGQRFVYVEWLDGRGKSGRTGCDAERASKNAHMQALIARGHREGVSMERQTW